MEFSKSTPYWAGLRKHKADPGAVWEGSTIEISKSPPYNRTQVRYGRAPQLKLANHPHIWLG